MSEQNERARIIARLRRLRREIEVEFNTCAHWNDYSTARKAGCDPIDQDPYGDLRRLAAAIDTLLAEDPGHGPIAYLDFARSH